MHSGSFYYKTMFWTELNRYIWGVIRSITSYRIHYKTGVKVNNNYLNTMKNVKFFLGDLFLYLIYYFLYRPFNSDAQDITFSLSNWD